MLEPDKTNNETIISRMAVGEKKARRFSKRKPNGFTIEVAKA